MDVAVRIDNSAAFFEDVKSVGAETMVIGWVIHPISLSHIPTKRVEGGENPVIEYIDAPDIKEKLNEIVELLRFHHVDVERLLCVRSTGSRSHGAIARIHGLGRIWQYAMQCKPIYIVEVISERFDKLNKDQQNWTLIHELLHIPRNFGGGFRYHKDQVNKENVETWYRRYREKLIETKSANK